MSGKLRVLLLENSCDDAIIAARETRDVATMDVAINGDAFREMLNEAWDVIVTDLGVPGITGLDAIRLARERHPDTPVIIVTGSVTARQADDACKAGASRFFLKQFDGVPGLATALLQVHEMRLLTEQSRKDNRMEILGHNTAGITHDLNNILHVVVNGPDILRRDLGRYKLVPLERGAEPEPLPQSMERVLSAMEGMARRGADMSRQMVTFVRGSNGTSLKATAPEFLLTELGKFLRDTFPKNIRLSFATLPGTATVKCDPTQIEQLLMNLAVNARDAMPHGGQLTVTAQNTVLPSGRFVVIEMRDTGGGIPADALPHIFEPFFTTKDKGKGTGLGLSMAQKLARDHGGEITVTTSATGTSFFLYLPQTQAETHAEAVARAVEFNGHGRTVLVVDDEAYMRMFVEMHLKDAHYKVLTAGSGMEALSYFRSNANVAVLLSDCGMPVMSGQELAAALRGQGYEMPIVFLTGATDETTFEPAPDAVLLKPFTRTLLLETLAQVLTKADAGDTQGA